MNQPHRRPPLYAEETMRQADGAIDAPALSVVFPVRLTHGDLDLIPDNTASPEEIWGAIAPYVVAWNLVVDGPDGPQAVPPPAEAGPDVCGHLTAMETAWLLHVVKQAHLATPRGEEDRKKDLAGSGSMHGVCSTSDSAKQTPIPADSPWIGRPISRGTSVRSSRPSGGTWMPMTGTWPERFSAHGAKGSRTPTPNRSYSRKTRPGWNA